jgi:hypothetical protein
MSLPGPHPDPLDRGTPYQNVTDPQHCLLILILISFPSFSIFSLLMFESPNSHKICSGVLSARYRQRTAGSESWSCRSQGTVPYRFQLLVLDVFIIPVNPDADWIIFVSGSLLNNRDSSQDTGRKK